MGIVWVRGPIIGGPLKNPTGDEEICLALDGGPSKVAPKMAGK